VRACSKCTQGAAVSPCSLQDPEEKAFKLNVELNNGRAAMFGIMGLLTQDAVNGEVFIGPFAQ
jgi:hypothetical protein